MPHSFRALCNDFYINQKLAVKMDLPTTRETVLELFERIRREHPSMSAFRKFNDELALECPPATSPHRWVAVRPSNIRSGVVNPEHEQDAYGLHRTLLEVCPYYLSVSPLDIDFVELLYGFDLGASGNHDGIVADALLAGSPLGALAEAGGATVADCQPVVGCLLSSDERIEAHFEVKTRSNGQGAEPGEEPISVYLTLRRYEPVTDLRQLTQRFDELTDFGHELVAEHVVPMLLTPLREAIASSA